MSFINTSVDESHDKLDVRRHKCLSTLVNGLILHGRKRLLSNILVEDRGNVSCFCDVERLEVLDEATVRVKLDCDSGLCK